MRPLLHLLRRRLLLVLLLLLLLLVLLLLVLPQRAVDAGDRVADPLQRRVVRARVEGLEEGAQSRHEPAPLPSVGVGPRGLDPLRDPELLLRRVLQPVEPHLELVYRHLVRG